jgi:hypothetical protein
MNSYTKTLPIQWQLIMTSATRAEDEYRLEWRARLAELAAFVTAHGRAPLQQGETEKRLSNWVKKQKDRRTSLLFPMTWDAIRREWDAMVTEHPCCLDEPPPRWYNTMAELVRFVEEHNATPRRHSKCPAEVALNKWMFVQKANRKLKQFSMADATKRDQWDKVSNQLAVSEPWRRTFFALRKHLLTHGTTPTRHSNERKLFFWMQGQKEARVASKGAMESEANRVRWDVLVREFAPLLNCV